MKHKSGIEEIEGLLQKGVEVMADAKSQMSAKDKTLWRRAKDVSQELGWSRAKSFRVLKRQEAKELELRGIKIEESGQTTLL